MVILFRGNNLIIGLPMIKSLSTGPHALESELSARLSPITKYCLLFRLYSALLNDL